jgi:hypothetical protein
MQRNGQKRDNKNRSGKTTGKVIVFCFLSFFGKKFSTFDMDSPQRVFNGVFELPLLRNAQKRRLLRKKNLKNSKKKKTTYEPRLAAIWP